MEIQPNYLPTMAKHLRLLLIALFLGIGFSVTFASSAFAEAPTIPITNGGGGSGAPELGRPSLPSPSPGGSTNPSPPPAPSPGGGGSGGGGGGGGGDASLPSSTYSVYHDGYNPACGVKRVWNGVRYIDTYAVGYKLFYRSGYEIGNTSPPVPGASYIAPHPSGGLVWNVTRQVGMDCIYAVAHTTLEVITCSIQVDIRVSMLSPMVKHDPSVYVGNSVYPRGSKDINACRASANRYQFGIERAVTEYGYYQATGTERLVPMSIYTTTLTNPETGSQKVSKDIILGAERVTSPRLLTTFSLQCKNGFNTPGVMSRDWTEQSCQGTGGGTSHKCNANPIQYDVADGTSTSMKTFSNNRVQMLRDGKARKMNFDQYITGKNISVNSYKTHFVRNAGSTPWNTAKSYNNNLFELRKDIAGGSILTSKNGTSSPTYSGRINTLYASGYSASEVDAPTKIQQELNWSGTRTITSYKITSFNNGGVQFTPITLKVPTSGVCTQEAVIDYVRAIGHEAG